MQLRPTMLLAIIPGLIAVGLFVATIAMKPQRARATMLPPEPVLAAAKA